MCKDINQTGHGLDVGDVVRLDGTDYVLAQADSETNAEAVGVVSEVADADNFTLCTSGHITGLTGLTAGAVYYLDDDTAGLLTSTEPPDVGDVSKPLLIADTTTSGWIFNMRGFINSGAAAFGNYTPTLTASVTNPTLGSGSVQLGRYIQIGELVIGVARITFGSSGAAAGSGNYIFSLPVAMESSWNSTGRIIGNGLLIDSGTTRRSGVLRSDPSLSSTQAFISADDTNGPTGAAVPWTWANNDTLEFMFFYEAA